MNTKTLTFVVFLLVVSFSNQAEVETLLEADQPTCWEEGIHHISDCPSCLWSPHKEDTLCFKPEDGNLVYSRQGKELWQTFTSSVGADYLAVQDDGNLVLYTAKNVPVWNSDTSGKAKGKHTKLCMNNWGFKLYAGEDPIRRWEFPCVK
mmetsp:Transcript_16604/g.17293  ORF Transcript_16604/g.17293 Transcript_16604/m.17293 type:complete len:149 (-) Transcript_16604:132-578(-)